MLKSGIKNHLSSRFWEEREAIQEAGILEETTSALTAEQEYITHAATTLRRLRAHTLSGADDAQEYWEYVCECVLSVRNGMALIEELSQILVGTFPRVDQLCQMMAEQGVV